MSPVEIIAIGCGGALGALTRAYAGRMVQSTFPYATLLVNVAGCLVLAMAYAGLPEDSTVLRATLGAGFCGAMTTFSTFMLECVVLFRTGHRRIALLYPGVTLVLCSLASWTGISLMT